MSDVLTIALGVMLGGCFLLGLIVSINIFLVTVFKVWWWFDDRKRKKERGD